MFRQTPADNGSSGGSNMDSSSSMESMSGMDSSATTSSTEVTSIAAVTQASSTTVAWGSYQTPTYGSGSSNWGSWGGSNYNDCVSRKYQKHGKYMCISAKTPIECMAQYGNSPQPWTPPPSQTTPDSGSVGTGATHTVIVAPSQGVLRYIPFAVNASVGDTVKFMWGANNHTVTKSSSLEPCNKTSDSPFTSGVQVKDFTCKSSLLRELCLIAKPLSSHSGG